jgi:glucosyl-dolichyl phosphate glucuronosyltransferase
MIPTFNRAEILCKCLEHLSHIEPTEFDWEIIVVDNGSTDRTNNVVKNAQQKNERIKYIYESRPGQHMARNTGCENSSGTILCFLDDDSFVSPTWLRAIEESFSDSSIALVGGPCLPLYGGTPLEWLEYFWSVNKYGKVLHQLSLMDLGMEKRIIDPTLVFGCNFSIRKEIYIQAGGSRPDVMPPGKEIFQGDGETTVARMVANLGLKAIYSPGVKIQHLVPKSRLAPEYFLRNARYKGVGKSFTEYRTKNNVDNNYFRQKNKNIVSKISYIISRLRNYIGMQRRLLPIGKPAFVAKMMRDVYNEMLMSYHLHKTELEKNPKLKEWVLRKNYFGKNGELP